MRRDVLEIVSAFHRQYVAKCRFRIQVLEFCEKHKKDSCYDETATKTLEMETWDFDFILRHANKLYGIIMAANYLEVGALLYDICSLFIVKLLIDGSVLQGFGVQIHRQQHTRQDTETNP